jgi:hypothetical protein
MNFPADGADQRGLIPVSQSFTTKDTLLRPVRQAQGYGGQAKIKSEVRTHGFRVSFLNPSVLIRAICGKKD